MMALKMILPILLCCISSTLSQDPSFTSLVSPFLQKNFFTNRQEPKVKGLEGTPGESPLRDPLPLPLHYTPSFETEPQCTCVPANECSPDLVYSPDNKASRGRSSGQRSPNSLQNRHKSSLCDSNQVCCSAEGNTLDDAACGLRSPIPASGLRILTPERNGSLFGEWPWQAAVLRFNGEINTFECGAVLLDHLHVLTVAHCVHKFGNSSNKMVRHPVNSTFPNPEIIARLGEYDTNSLREVYPHEDYLVEKIVIHPDYSKDTLANDIAILRLKEKVLFKQHILPICLPSARSSFEGLRCTSTGWGQDAYRGTYSNILKAVNVPVINSVGCVDSLRKTKLGKRFSLHPSFICAGGEEGIDACKGDGGGPLVCPHPTTEGKYVLSGITSWGIDCGSRNVPGVYVSVPYFVQWIEEAIKALNLNESPDEHKSPFLKREDQPLFRPSEVERKLDP